MNKLKIFTDHKKISKKFHKSSLVIGNFDGVHLGHQKIVNQLVQTARKVGGKSVLLTFDPHPRVVLQPDVELKLLSSIEEKIELLEKTGLDHLMGVIVKH